MRMSGPQFINLLNQHPDFRVETVARCWIIFKLPHAQNMIEFDCKGIKSHPMLSMSKNAQAILELIKST